MTRTEDLDADDFSDIYKAYTGPVKSNPQKEPEKTTNKRSHVGHDEEEEARDPNAVPTDFTSREAKVWEAKSKAIERNWKKRKEEELICKICGESGHFTQGCPSTLGASRKSQDFFERVPARDPHVRALFTEKVVKKIEDIGCKIKIDEKFIIVSGKDRLILRKGVDAVHKIKEDGDNKVGHRSPKGGENKVFSSSPVSRAKSLERRSPHSSRIGRSGSQKPNSTPHNAPHIPHKHVRQERVIEDHVRQDIQKLSSGSPHAYVSDGGRGRPSCSKSPTRPSYFGNSYNNSYEGHPHNRGDIRTDSKNSDRGILNIQPDHPNFDYPSLPRTLEDLELQYKRDAMELARMRDEKQEEENCTHRKALREIWESRTKNAAAMRSTHINMWNEFLQAEAQRMQEPRQHIPTSGFAGYNQSRFELDTTYGNPYRSEDVMDVRSRYPNAVDHSYPSPSPQEPYEDLQRQVRDDMGRPYHRY